MISKFLKLIILPIFFFSCTEPTGINKGSKMKDFMLNTLDHKRFYLNDQKGKVVVLIFWATWCTVCKKEMVEFESYRKKAGNSKLTIAAVCIDPEDIDKIQRITSTLEINYPVLLDTEAKLHNSFKTKIVPKTIIINPDGNIDEIVEGFDEQIMRKLCSRIELLSEKY